MERYLEQSATPARVRYAMKKHMKGYDISKIDGTWYIVGADTPNWFSTSLATATLTLPRVTVAYWIQVMMQMRDAHQYMMQMRD